MQTEETVRVAVVGAAGRMGREVLRALTSDHGFDVRAAVDSHHPGASARELAGPTVADLTIEDKLGAALDRASVDVVVDFSHHRAAGAHALTALKRGASPVIGCTGLSEEDVQAIAQACDETGVPAMIVPNFAIGAVLMMRFSQMAARWMPDAEIIELHHDRKEDAPSGTAMLTARLIAEARTERPTPLPTPHLKAEGARGGLVREVPVHSVRLPGLLAHQQVMFGGPGETLTIRHDSMDRASFMPGVRLAARRVRSLSGLVVGLDGILFE